MTVACCLSSTFGIVRISIPSSSFAAILPVSQVLGIYLKEKSKMYFDYTLEGAILSFCHQIGIVVSDNLLLALSINTYHIVLHLNVNSILWNSRNVTDHNKLRISLYNQFSSSMTTSIISTSIWYLSGPLLSLHIRLTPHFHYFILDLATAERAKSSSSK